MSGRKLTDGVFLFLMAFTLLTTAYCFGYSKGEDWPNEIEGNGARTGSQPLPTPMPTPALESYEVRDHYERELNKIDPAFFWTCQHRYYAGQYEGIQYDSMIFCMTTGDEVRMTMFKVVNDEGSTTFQRTWRPLGPYDDLPRALRIDKSPRGEEPDSMVVECKYTNDTNDTAECGDYIRMKYSEGKDWITDFLDEYWEDLTFNMEANGGE